MANYKLKKRLDSAGVVEDYELFLKDANSFLFYLLRTPHKR